MTYKSTKLVVNTLNDHTLTLVDDGETITIRIAKDGHNRAIAKLSVEHWNAMASHMAKVRKANGRKT